MLKKNMCLYVCLVMAILSCCSCSSPAPEPAEPDIIPLDGRGGGVIAYTYQSGDGSGLNQIFAVNADGSGNVQLSHATIGLNYSDWSPDRNRLAMVGYIQYETTWSIHTMNADGSQLTRLTHTDGAWDEDPAWSPDGRRIAFARTDPQTRHSEMWIMNDDGGSQNSIGIEGFQPKWSADGARFLYSSNKAGNWEIYTCRIDGSDEQRLTDAGSDESNASWSPDNRLIAFTSNRDGNLEIYAMNADGTIWRRLTNSGATELNPRFSPDSSLIAFYSDLSAAGHWEVYLIGADGSNPRRVTNSPGNNMASNPDWKPMP